MLAVINRIPSLCLLMVLIARPCNAQTSTASDLFPLDENAASCSIGANLNDLAIISEDRLIAIGDRGLILKSDSGGRKWAQTYSSTTANLHGIDFDRNQTGLIVGGWVGNYTRLSHALVLRSADGGQTWQQMQCEMLPRLSGVRFLGGKVVAWGDYSPSMQTSVFESLDGGVTWQPSGIAIGHASAATVAQGGIVGAVDFLGRAVFKSRQIESRTIAQAGRPIRALHHTGTHWLACGVGGELITSRDGTEWDNVLTPISKEAVEFCDWNTIEQVGDAIWVAGSPGSVILHSRDRGLSWIRLETEQSLPIASLEFLDASRGWSVGPLGNILATRDGGRTWYVQRAACQRTGLLSIASSDDLIPWVPAVAAAWGQQIATVSVTTSSCDAIEYADFLPNTARQLEALAPQAGIAQHYHWPAGLAQTEAETAKLKCAIELLTWRPDIVLISGDSGQPESSRVRLDPERYVAAAIAVAEKANLSEVAKELALPAWSVKKLVAVTDKNSSQYSEQPLRILRDPGLAIWDLLHPLPPEVRLDATNVSMRTVWTNTRSPAAMQSLMGAVASSTETAMELPIKSIGNYQLVMGRVHRERTLEKLGDKDGRIASDQQWEDALRMVLRAFPESEVAPSVYRLSKWLATPRDWPRRRILLQRLIEMEPSTDAADWARIVLIRTEASEEYLAWKRFEGATSSSMHLTEKLTGEIDSPTPVPGKFVPGALVQGIDDLEQANSKWNASPFRGGEDAVADSVDASVVSASLELVNESLGQSDAERIKSWFPFFEDTVRFSPELRTRADLSLLTYRQQRRFAEASQVGSSYELDRRVFAKALIGWPQVASQELRAVNNQLGASRWLAMAEETSNPPVLDGNLDEPFWITAQSMKLAKLEEESLSHIMPSSQMKWAYDDDFLYIAIECKRKDVEEVNPLQRARTHDSDLSGTDRVEFLLDTDRDYNSAIELAVADDGRTFDRCMGQKQYNPKWYVFVKPEPTQWIAEIAVKLNALTTQEDLSGKLWAISARRHQPGAPSQSWSQLRTHQPLLQASGLLLFIPSGR